jgi:hypothetical protein
MSETTVTSNNETAAANYDEPWKEALERYFDVRCGSAFPSYKLLDYAWMRQITGCNHRVIRFLQSKI